MKTEVVVELLSKSCADLPKGSPSLPNDEVVRLSAAVPEWQVEGSNIVREYKMSSYMAGVRWFALLASIAEAENHHPDVRITWRRVKVSLWTHTVNGLSINDFILAAKLDQAWEEFQRQESQR